MCFCQCTVQLCLEGENPTIDSSSILNQENSEFNCRNKCSDHVVLYSSTYPAVLVRAAESCIRISVEWLRVNRYFSEYHEVPIHGVSYEYLESWETAVLAILVILVDHRHDYWRWQ